MRRVASPSPSHSHDTCQPIRLDRHWLPTYFSPSGDSARSRAKHLSDSRVRGFGSENKASCGGTELLDGSAQRFWFLILVFPYERFLMILQLILADDPITVSRQRHPRPPLSPTVPSLSPRGGLINSHVILATVDTPEQHSPALPRPFPASNPASLEPNPFPSPLPAFLYPQTWTPTTINPTGAWESSHSHPTSSPRQQIPHSPHLHTYIAMYIHPHLL